MLDGYQILTTLVIIVHTSVVCVLVESCSAIIISHDTSSPLDDWMSSENSDPAGTANMKSLQKVAIITVSCNIWCISFRVNDFISYIESQLTQLFYNYVHINRFNSPKTTEPTNMRGQQLILVTLKSFASYRIKTLQF